MKAQVIFQQHYLLIGALLLAVAGIPEVAAQSMTPLTGKLLQEPVAAASSPSPPVSAPVSNTPAAAQAAAPAAAQPAVEQESRIRIGDVTRTLLQAQVDGRVAGGRLPILGATADASWQRYLDTFKHSIPEHFEATVSKSTSN